MDAPTYIYHRHQCLTEKRVRLLIPHNQHFTDSTQNTNNRHCAYNVGVISHQPGVEEAPSDQISQEGGTNQNAKVAHHRMASEYMVLCHCEQKDHDQRVTDELP